MCCELFTFCQLPFKHINAATESSAAMAISTNRQYLNKVNGNRERTTKNANIEEEKYLEIFALNKRIHNEGTIHML